MASRQACSGNICARGCGTCEHGCRGVKTWAAMSDLATTFGVERLGTLACAACTALLYMPPRALPHLSHCSPHSHCTATNRVVHLLADVVVARKLVALLRAHRHLPGAKSAGRALGSTLVALALSIKCAPFHTCLLISTPPGQCPAMRSRPTMIPVASLPPAAAAAPGAEAPAPAAARRCR